MDTKAGAVLKKSIMGAVENLDLSAFGLVFEGMGKTGAIFGTENGDYVQINAVVKKDDFDWI